jgi:SAM-dependent methyltransferase
MRFVWGEVEQDILKILYENFIGTETRKKLGEYYTPDWLAEIMVAETITEPTKTRVLDPSCGSGTFLFHAVRRYIAAAEADGVGVAKLLTGVTRHVIGMDLHPVAVTLARVTYILAIGRGSDLCFPDALLDDASKFDNLVNELAGLAAKRKANSPVPSLKALFLRLEVSKEYQDTIIATFKTMCRLHDEGRDHIWGYYVRNLARPLWLSRPGNQVDMLIGNPPWLAYSHMTPDMQETFRAMSERRDMWAGGQLAPHQDLSGLFVVRACELYLRKDGRFAMVLPNAAIDREHYAGFRRGKYSDEVGVLLIDFGPSWDLRRIRPHFFPRAACVVFGTRVDNALRGYSDETTPDPLGMPDATELWTGRMEVANASWAVASGWLTRSEGKVRHVGQLSKSPYAVSFTQGAILAPHFIFVVQKQSVSPIGTSQGRTAIQSHRTVLEKKPWKTAPDITGVVETQFLRPFFAGENVFPFALGPEMLSLIPCNETALLNQEGIDMYPGLQQWWADATMIWEEKRSSERLSLTEQLDFQSKLSKQLPIPSIRVVYNRSGMHVCCAKLRNQDAIVGSGLYWAPVSSEEEADYICGILNAPVTTELARPLMSYGKDERDIHKHVWELPIPAFDGGDPIHCRIADLVAAIEKIVATFPIDSSLHFAATRRHIRDFVSDTVEGQELNDLVSELIA